MKSKIILFICCIGMFSCSNARSNSKDTSKEPTMNNENTNVNDKVQPKTTDTALLGGGCFWCIEAVYQDLKGVVKIESGYAGGKIKNPTYREVCSGLTGHAEVTQITFDSSIISYDELLEVFFTAHDPTTLNRQGNDVGTQYRSVIYYYNDEQKAKAEFYINELTEQKAFPNPIVTEVTPAPAFYVAEDYHQDYFELHGEEPYCKLVIRPKVDKVKKVFADKMKNHN